MPSNSSPGERHAFVCKDGRYVVITLPDYLPGETITVRFPARETHLDVDAAATADQPEARRPMPFCEPASLTITSQRRNHRVEDQKDMARRVAALYSTFDERAGNRSRHQETEPRIVTAPALDTSPGESAAGMPPTASAASAVACRIPCSTLLLPDVPNHPRITPVPFFDADGIRPEGQEHPETRTTVQLHDVPYRQRQEAEARLSVLEPSHLVESSNGAGIAGDHGVDADGTLFGPHHALHVINKCQGVIERIPSGEHDELPRDIDDVRACGLLTTVPRYHSIPIPDQISRSPAQLKKHICGPALLGTRSRGRRVADRPAQLSNESRRVLKQWLNAHIEHPYPLWSEKHALAQAANLSVNQVSAWFKSYRKRHWKRDLIDAQYGRPAPDAAADAGGGATWSALDGGNSTGLEVRAAGGDAPAQLSSPTEAASGETIMPQARLCEQLHEMSGGRFGCQLPAGHGGPHRLFERACRLQARRDGDDSERICILDAVIVQTAEAALSEDNEEGNVGSGSLLGAMRGARSERPSQANFAPAGRRRCGAEAAMWRWP